MSKEMKISKIIYSPIIPLAIASILFFGALLYAVIVSRYEAKIAAATIIELEGLHKEVYALTQEGKYYEALVKAEEAIRLGPNHIETWVDKGMTLYLSGDCTGGAAALYHAVNLDPADESVGNMLGMMLNTCGGESDVLDKDCADSLTAQNKYLEGEKLSEKYTFEKYPATLSPIQNLADLDVTSNKYAEMFRTTIRQDLEKGIDFAGHYTMASIGLTGWPQSFLVVDRLNGKAYQFPYVAYELDFRRDSNLLIMDSKDVISKYLISMKDSYSSPCVNIKRFDIDTSDITSLRPFYFLWEDNEFKLLGPNEPKPSINYFWKDYLK